MKKPRSSSAGVKPLDLLQRYPHRFRQMHVKDILPSTRTNYDFQQDPTEVGRGSVPWATLLPAAHEAGVRRFFVEQEPPFKMDRFAAIRDSFEYLDRVA